jgi:hypothetical protein
MQLPFNNTCGENKLRDLKFGNVALAYVGDTNNHIKSALPPTLTEFPGEAEIRYYVKATVKRPQIWRADIRCVSDFNPPPPGWSKAIANDLCTRKQISSSSQ